MSRLRSAWAGVRARPGLAAIVCLGFAWALTMHSVGWAQLAHYAQVRALADGQAEIDPWHWETNDKAWIEGNFYSVKSPGTAALTTPLYVAIESAGGLGLAEDAAATARQTEYPRWTPPSEALENFGYDPERSDAVQARIENGAPVVWALTLLAAVIPAVLLLLGVRWAADRIEPGYGTAAAITLGVASMVMVFASEYFSHVISAALGFAAFLVLMREREGPPNTRAVALAGALAGLAISFEYQVGLVGVVLFCYALARSAAKPARAAAFVLAGFAGTVPALAFNVWALGSPFEFAYGAAVAVPGISGHDVLGLNDDGFFGITLPLPAAAIDLLFSSRGLLVLTPVAAAAAAGVLAMRRGAHRAEANVVLAIAAAYFLYNAGYWLTFGGGTPGPRFLIPALPFLALGLAPAYRRFPATTLALAVPSAVFMCAAAISYPLLGRQGPGTWLEYIWDGELEHTVLTVLGVSNAWLALVPVIALLAAAIALAVRATPGAPVGDARLALAALAGWAAISVLAPGIVSEDAAPLEGDPNAIYLVAVAVVASLAALAALRAPRVPGPKLEHDPAGELAALEREPVDGGAGGGGLRRPRVPIGVEDDAAHPEDA